MIRIGGQCPPYGITAREIPGWAMKEAESMKKINAVSRIPARVVIPGIVISVSAWGAVSRICSRG